MILCTLVHAHTCVCDCACVLMWVHLCMCALVYVCAHACACSVRVQRARCAHTHSHKTCRHKNARAHTCLRIRYFLQLVGLIDDVTIRTAQPLELDGLWQRGEVEGVFVWAPHFQRLEQAFESRRFQMVRFLHAARWTKKNMFACYTD